MNILITGDLVLSQPYSISLLADGLVKLFLDSDCNVVNLEAPVTNSTSKILKTGPNLKSHKTSTLEFLKTLNINIATLANNHVLDFDKQGVMDTLDFCKRNNIKTVGAGINLEDASKTLFLDSKEGYIGLVNFSENEWTVATNTTAGANPMDFIDNYRQIQEAKNKADFVLVIVHGGNEYNPYPSPRMVKQYRFYAEVGADVVIGHHTHCISGFERHHGAPIFYSLGNFLFTMEKKNPDCWYSGLAVQLEIKKGSKIEFEVIPVCQDKESQALSVMEDQAKVEIFELIDEINDVIADNQRLEESWKTFVETVQGNFIKSISPLGGIKNKYLKAALYRSDLYKLLLHNRYLKEHLNRIRCEAHHDVTQTILTNYLKDKVK